MKQKLYGNKLAAIFFAAALALSLTGLTEARANTCEAACNKYVACVVAMHANASAKQKQTLTQGCMQTCGKNKEKTIACYTSAKDSCSALHSCIMANSKK